MFSDRHSLELRPVLGEVGGLLPLSCSEHMSQHPGNVSLEVLGNLGPRDAESKVLSFRPASVWCLGTPETQDSGCV